MDSNNSKLSRRTLIQLGAISAAAALATRTEMAWGQDPADPAPMATFQNPLFAGDYADPTITRVGSDFYATFNCYQYAPGLTVWHSRDLVNWEPISSALPTLTGKGEVWSPDISEHEGEIYIYYPHNGRIMVVHATDPRGPWSEPVDLGIKDIDPCHVVGPDGTRYLYIGAGKVTQLSADGLSTVGETKKVYEGWKFPKEWVTEGFWLESPKVTRRGDTYYLISAQGGTSGPPTSHMAVVARSKSPLGPWENSPSNPLIHTYSADEEWWSVGHGTLLSTPDDRWYFVYHGYRKGFQTLGRHTLMEPVEWSADGWPIAPLGARRSEPMPAPMGIQQKPMIALSDDFRAPTLRATWGIWSEPDMSRFQVGDGTLKVRGKGDNPGKNSPLAVMARDTSYEVSVAATPSLAGVAALGLFYSENHWLFTELKNGELSVRTPKETLATRNWTAPMAHLRIVNRLNKVAFEASADRTQWQTLVADVDVAGYTNNDIGGFLTLRPALAATGAGEARFSDFVYRAL